MPRSTSLQAYPKVWHSLLEHMTTSTHPVTLTFDKETAAYAKRQEWYAFLRAIKQEAARDPSDRGQPQGTFTSKWRIAKAWECILTPPTFGDHHAYLLFQRKDDSEINKTLLSQLANQIPTEPSFEEEETPDHNSYLSSFLSKD